jgi:putative membrane protein
MSQADTPAVAQERAPLPLPLACGAGLLMGAADSVPGVSGGTIALILGVFERLVDSLSICVRLPSRIRSPEGRAELRAALTFLVPLGVGVLAAYFVGTRILVGPTESPGLLRRAETAPLCYAFFLGLVLFSLPEPWRRIPKHTAGSYVCALVAAVFVAWLVGLEHATRAPADWMLFVGGALAISVMLLPGISGSLLLLVLGQYTTVAGAVHNLGDPQEVTRLALFLGGVVVGIALFVPLLRRLLRDHHDLTLAALTGLMAGSIRALWPWKSHYDLKDLSLGRMVNTGIGENWPWVLVALAGGAASVWLLDRLAARITRADA